jgi:hypothetical protein
MRVEELDESRRTTGGGFMSVKNAHPLGFVQPYKRQGSLTRKNSQLTGFRGDLLKKTYIDGNLD